MSADDIRAGFAGADDFAKQDTFKLPDYIVPHDWNVAEIAMELYGLDAQELGLMYDVKEHRMVFPIIHDDKIVDATGRSLGKRLPKWKRYGKSGLPYVSGHGKVAVVVEDCLSAAVVGYGTFVGVALLGTSLQESHKRYLSQFSTAIIALDPDALPKTLQMAKELRGHVNDVRVLKLTDDLKYRNPTDMENLHGIINN
jgi:DNA primase